MGALTSVHGKSLGFNKTHLFLHGRPVNNDEVGFGKTYYVDSGIAGLDGTSPDTAIATWDGGHNKCVASQGDKIVLLPGHSETITATDVTLDTIGVKTVGLGWGTDMPLMDMTVAAGEISVAADNVEIEGVHFHANVTAVLVGIEIEDGSDHCRVGNCWFDVETTTTDEFNVCIRTNDASNYALIHDNLIDMGLGGAVSAISFTKDTDHTRVYNNQIFGDYSTANINGITTASTLLDISGNTLFNGVGGNLNAQPVIELLTGSTGVIAWNWCVCNLATKVASIVSDTCMLFENYYNEDIQGTGGLIGTVSADD